MADTLDPNDIIQALRELLTLALETLDSYADASAEDGGYFLPNRAMATASHIETQLKVLFSLKS